MPFPSFVFAALRRTAAVLAGVLFVSIAVGWLYWLRGPTTTWPGPRIVDALPLDELSNHGDVSLLVFAIVMAPAGLAVAAVVRFCRLDGFAVALTVGFASGAWLFVASVVSIFVVQQDSFDAALATTRSVAPIYLTAAIFACATIIVAGRRTGEQWLTRLVPGAVGIVGVITLLDATWPSSREGNAPFGGLLSATGSPATRTLDVSIGIVLLLCARGLTRRSRRAVILAVLLVTVALVTRMVDGFDPVGLVLSALVLVSLLARRSDFSFAGDPTTRAAGVMRVVGLFGCAVLYGVSALAINRVDVGLPVHPLSLLRGTLHALILGAPRAGVVPGQFVAWFPWSLRAIVALGLVWGAASWFAPWRHHLVEEPVEGRLHAKRLVALWGRDTLAPFIMRQDKAYYLYPEGPIEEATTVIAYRVVRGVAIVSGDPIGPDDQAAAAIAAFKERCARRGWHFAVIGAGERLLGTYRDLGLHVVYHGDEAIIDTGSFSLSGGELKSVRQAVHRVARKGYAVEIRSACDIGQSTREALLALEREWLAGDPRKGFVMELDELFRLDGDDAALFVIGRAPNGELAGFLEIAPCPASSSLSLSSMPRASSAANGLNAFLIVNAIEWAAVHGYGTFSLNFSPAARLLDRGGPRPFRRRVAQCVLLVCKRILGLQLDNLLLFNRHFAPRWESRYLVVDALRHLPRVIVAAMAAEGYLPFAAMLRGRDWAITVPNH